MRDIMIEKKKYIAQKEKKELRLKLYKRDRSNCHYCGIEEEDFFQIWGKFYGGKRRKLEVDRKDNKKSYNEENCVLICPICNSAKSDRFTYEEFKKVGKVIKEMWLSRKEVIKKAKSKSRRNYTRRKFDPP